MPPTRKRKPKAAAPVTMTLRLDSADVAALDALTTAGIRGFPIGDSRKRSARIRWLIHNFGRCHARLQHAHEVAADNAVHHNQFSLALAAMSAALRAAGGDDDAGPTRLDSGDLDFF